MPFRPTSYVKDIFGNAATTQGGSVACYFGTVDFEDTTAKNLCELPAGAVIVDIRVDVLTAFDGASTKLLTVGPSDDPDGYVDDLDVSSAATSRLGDTSIAASIAGGTPLVVPTVVVGTFADGGADATEGEAAVYIWFVIR